MKNDCDEMMELDFRRWIMRNFCELKDKVAIIKRNLMGLAELNKTRISQCNLTY